MKYLLLLLFTFVSFTYSFSQNVNIKGMNERQKKDYLINLGKEVTKKYGPEYYREGVTAIITQGVFESDDQRDEISKNLGREYYIVTFPYDKSKETLEFDYSSRVKIWKDSGEPLEVIFGNGHGKNFLFLSYREQNDTRAIIEVIPYQQADTSQVNIWIEEKKQ